MKRLVALLLIILCAVTLMAQETTPAPLRVGLITDASCTDGKSREAAWKLISAHPDFQADRISASLARENGFADYDVVIFPGGTGSGQANALGVDGGAALEKFAESGHGVIAICAGGYLVAEGWNETTSAVELINAQLWDLDHWARGETMINVRIVGRNDAASSRTMWFENGPIFAPASIEGLPAYTPLVTYNTDLAAKDAPKGMMLGRDAVVAAHYGDGRVVAFGPHPELSPQVNHWLINAIKWSAGQRPAEPTVENVLGE